MDDANNVDPDQMPHSAASALFANYHFGGLQTKMDLTLVMLNKLKCHTHF